MILEHLEAYLRQQAEIKADTPNNPFRASSMGRCIREGCYDLIGLRPEPLQPRRMLTLEHGTVIHDNLLTPLIKNAMGWRVVSGAEFGDCEFEIDGVKISFHIDLAFQHDTIDPLSNIEDIGVAEIKGWADMTFKKAEQGEIDHDILCQGWTYHQGTSFNPVVFLGFRKETSHMVEICFNRNVHEKVVTQTLTTDPIAKAKADPILLTEIRSPFDLSVEEYVRDRIKWLKIVRDTPWVISEDQTKLIERMKIAVPGADAVEDEIEKVQGKVKADEMFAKGYVIDVPPGKGSSWYAFKTGRKILKFPCSYCGHKDRCFTAKMEMKGDRPIWLVG